MKIGKMLKMDAMAYEDVELGLETVAKVKKLCKSRGLPFPDGIDFLLKEVVQHGVGVRRQQEKTTGRRHRTGK